MARARTSLWDDEDVLLILHTFRAAAGKTPSLGVVERCLPAFYPALKQAYQRAMTRLESGEKPSRTKIKHDEYDRRLRFELSLVRETVTPESESLGLLAERVERIRQALAVSIRSPADPVLGRKVDDSAERLALPLRHVASELERLAQQLTHDPAALIAFERAIAEPLESFVDRLREAVSATAPRRESDGA